MTDECFEALKKYSPSLALDSYRFKSEVFRAVRNAWILHGEEGVRRWVELWRETTRDQMLEDD